MPLSPLNKGIIKTASIPLTIFGIVVAAVARKFVPNCSAPIVTNIAQKPVPKPRPAHIQYIIAALPFHCTVKNKIINKEVPKYPSVRRDLSMLVDTNVTFDDLKTIAFKTERKLIKNVQVFDVYVGDKLPAGKKSYALNFTLQDEEQTLTDKQIDSVMQKIISNLAQTAKAEIRK